MVPRPVELLVLKFSGNEFADEIISALADLVDSNTIRIIDLLFAETDDEGDVQVLELDDLDKDACDAFNRLVSDITGAITKEDVQKLTRDLESNSSAALILFEDTWAIHFRDVVLNYNGRILFHEPIPPVVLEAALREPGQAASLGASMEYAGREDKAIAVPRRLVRCGPGLVTTVARTSVVAWTATAVAKGASNRAKGSQKRALQHEAIRFGTSQNPVANEQMQAEQADTAPAERLMDAPIAPDVTARIQEFANLKESGVLTDEEFAAAKAKLLGISDLRPTVRRRT